MLQPSRQILKRALLLLLLYIPFGIGLCVGIWPARPAKTTPPAATAVPVPAPMPAEAALERVLPRVDLNGVQLDAALLSLGKLAGTPVVFRYNQMQTPNIALIDYWTPVTIHARGETLERVLRELIEPRRSVREGERLAYTPSGDTVIVSTWWDLRSHGALTREFDVRDLIGPDRSLDALAKLVREKVAPESWGDPEGMHGFIRCLGGRLVVTQDWHVLRQTGQFLAELRKR
jgi:hypothetical protein